MFYGDNDSIHFYINNLDKVIDDDDSNKKEGLSYLKQLFFKNLLSVFLIPLLLSIIMLLGIIFLDSKNDKCILFFVNCSITLLVFSLYSFIIYITSALNPKLSIEAVVEYDYKTIMSGNKGHNKGNIDEFLCSYNLIEYTCKDILDKVIYYNKYNYISFPFCLKMFVRLEFIDNSHRIALNWLRVFRNAVVHSTKSIEIDEELCESVKEISVCFKENYEKIFINGKIKYDNKEVNDISFKFRNSINEVFINFYKLYINFSNIDFINGL